MAEQSTTPTIQEVRKACERRREQFFNYVQLDIRDVLTLCDEVDRLKAENERLEQRLQPIRIAGVEIPDPHPGYDCCGTCPLHLGLPYTAQD